MNPTHLLRSQVVMILLGICFQSSIVFAQNTCTNCPSSGAAPVPLQQACTSDSCTPSGFHSLGGESDPFLAGLIKPSDQCFDDFISPMINFVFFEDPRTVTELRPIFVSQRIPDVIGPGIPAGGSVQLYAMHIRAALTERLSFIATKDGFIDENTGGALDALIDDGWADVSVGLKYNFLRDVNSGTLGSFGFTYEIPMGSKKSLQNIGDGEFHLFGTLGQRLLDGNAHFLTSLGYRVPVDTSLQNTAIHFSNHLDARLTEYLYLFTEVAVWHWVDDAEAGLPLGVAGQDLFNLSSSNVSGNTLVTQNVGVKIKPSANTELGVAYEFPLTGFQDVIKDRIQVDLILRY